MFNDPFKKGLDYQTCTGVNKVDRNYYATITSAVGAAGNWTDDSAWVGGVKPTAADDAVLQATTTSMTVSSGAVCRSLDASLFTGTLTHTAGVDLTIGDATAGAGNKALDFGTFTYTLGNAATSKIVFLSSSATVQTINFNGLTTGNVSFSGSGKWQYTGAHTCGATATVTFSLGTLDINGQTCSWGKFDSSNANVRALTLGAANITITGTGVAWTTSNITNLTLSAASSTITLSGAGVTFAAGFNSTYGTVILSGSGAASLSTQAVYTAVTRNGTAAKSDTFTIDSSITVTTLTLNSNSDINRILVASTIVGTARTITAATVVITNTVDFQDITGAGAATWTVAGTGATALGDCGGNSGITFTTGATQTWDGTSGGNWSANAWTTRVPLPQDDVVISSAFSASQTVTADMPRLGKSIDWTGASGNPAWNFGSTPNTFYGSVTMISAMTRTGTQLLTFAGRGDYTITSNGVTFASTIGFTAPGGTYTLLDAFGNAGSMTLNNGTFNANNFNMTISGGGSFSSSNSNVRSLIMGSGTWTISSTGTFWNLATTTNLTFSGANASIVLSGTTASTRTFAGGGLTYGTLTYTVAGSTGTLDVTGSNTFSVINFSDVTNARSLRFTAGTTTTVGTFNVRGTDNKLMTVVSITGPTFTLAFGSQVNTNYLALTNCVASTTIPAYAGANSTDGTGNTNWIFAAAPSSGGSAGVATLQAKRNLQNLQNL